MLTWLNPFRWWFLLEQQQQWKSIEWHFIDACQHHDFDRAIRAVEKMIAIAIYARSRRLLLDSYQNLNLCQQIIECLAAHDAAHLRVQELQQVVNAELASYST